MGALCARCDQPFEARKPWQRYCSSACRKAAFRASSCVAKPDPLPSPLPCVAQPPTCQSDTVDGHGIPPLRYRPQLGDKDIRDIKGLVRGVQIEMPDLPACLDRRVKPHLLSEAAEGKIGSDTRRGVDKGGAAPRLRLCHCRASGWCNSSLHCLTAWSAIGSPPSLQRKEPPAFTSGSRSGLYSETLSRRVGPVNRRSK
jgi:hypothetical protein